MRWGLDADTINRSLTTRRVWQERMQSSWPVYWQEKPITDQTHADLIAVADVLQATTYDYRMVLNSDTVRIYSNHVELLEQLNQLDMISHRQATESEINRPKNTIILKNSPYRFRAYLKYCQITVDQKDNLIAFLENNRECLRPSPAFLSWKDYPYTRLREYFFLDLQDNSNLTFLELVCPGIIRKTVAILNK